jgi:hypothetical protein
MHYAFLHKENTFNFVSRVADPINLDRIRIPLVQNMVWIGIHSDIKVQNALDRYLLGY